MGTASNLDSLRQEDTLKIWTNQKQLVDITQRIIRCVWIPLVHNKSHLRFLRFLAVIASLTQTRSLNGNISYVLRDISPKALGMTFGASISRKSPCVQKLFKSSSAATRRKKHFLCVSLRQGELVIRLDPRPQIEGTLYWVPV